MKRILTPLSIAIGLSLFYTGIAFAQGETPPPAAAQGSDFAAKLAGIVAAAAVVERIIEMIWDFYENNILAASRLVGNSQSYVRWAQEQVSTAKAALVASSGTEASELEKAFQNAEQRLNDYLKSPFHVTLKKKLSVPAGIILGVVIAFAAQLQMFFLLGILGADSPLRGFDIFITGLIIGTGSAPVHSLIGILQNTKDAVDAARALYSGKAIAEVTDAIKKLETHETTVGTIRSSAASLQDVPAETTVETSSTDRAMLEIERNARRLVKL